MEQKYYSIIEMGFTGAVVIGFILWQLFSVNREIAKDKAKADLSDGKSPESAGHSVGEHRLDDR